MDTRWVRVQFVQTTVLAILMWHSLQKALGESNVLPLQRVYLTPESPVAYIESPNYPDALYPANTQKQYHVEAVMPDPVRQATVRILVSFEMFLMEKSHFCYKDGLDIVDRFGQLMAYCGPQAGRTLLTDDGTVRMRMYTDGETQDRGFRIRVKLYESPCSQTFKRKQSGLIKSPDYPYSYGAHRLCLWRIEAPRGKVVRLRFDGWFDIRSEDHETCLMDYLAVSRTGNFSTDIHRMCGQTRPTRITSKGNAIEIKFFSDCCEEGRGFQIRYDIVEPVRVTPTPMTHYTAPPTCSESKCGQANIVTARIVGGGEYNEHKYPWLVAIMNQYDEFICTGSLISQRHVLTAAHCCHKQRELYVRLGVHHLDDQPSRHIAQCIIHPGYKRLNYVNDIAVISLRQRVTPDSFVRPVCLPIAEDDDKIGKNGVIAGWGREAEGGKDRATPKEANVPFVSNAECVKKYGPVILDSNICAGGNMEDACQGDSGGPLMSPWHVDGKYVQVGVVSTGIGCGRDGFPGIYSRVSKYRGFISNITQEPWCSIDGDDKQPMTFMERGCGIPTVRRSKRIVGGSTVPNTKYPWLASIVYEDESIGTGSYIGRGFVLTSASAVVTALTHERNPLAVELLGQRIPVQRAYLHELYSFPHHDLALLYLSHRTEDFVPICIVNESEQHQTGDNVTVVGRRNVQIPQRLAYCKR
ncbi:ovochymase-2-like isoform X2 [Ornithodoros turicata]|uniref:ovochymase-2-like isoform X2 n=1 Tax=Ornithodoros turicata TaxID=34597 RepID=UPI00313A45AB